MFLNYFKFSEVPLGVTRDHPRASGEAGRHE
jgi:hypothetical protein